MRIAAFRVAFACGLVYALVSPPAPAQANYPTRPVRFIVPFPPGGSTDPMARLAAGKLAERWGQPVVVDNRPGGSTVIGAEAVAKSLPDGYTMLLASSSFINAPSLLPKLPYDPLKDFTGVGTIAHSRLLLTVPSSSPVNAFGEFIAYAKAKSGQLTYGSSGVGSNTHLSGALLNLLLGTKMNHIPYKGSGILLTDLVGGRLDIAFQVPISIIAHLKSGKLKALAITGERRATALPEIQTFAEAGMPSFGVSGWYGIVVPARTPKAVIERISADLVAGLSTPDAQAYIAKQGLEGYTTTPAEMTALVRNDIARHAKIIKDANIRLEN